MRERQFFEAMVKATGSGTLRWATLSKDYFQSVTNISRGIVDAFFAPYDDGRLNIVIYQFKTVSGWDDGEERISYFVSICDDEFRYKYEFNRQELGASELEIFDLYKAVQKAAGKIDSLLDEFIKDFGRDESDR